MVNPVTALALALVLAVGLAVAAWPRRGVLWRVLDAVRASERARIEDALKHLHNCEYARVPGTCDSLAGVLGLSRNSGASLVSRLIDRELARPEEGRVVLTDEGRRYALRVVRIHRLWERFLSDETSLPPSQWHEVADRREHRTTPEEAERLAARMGYPQFDPHGDPIPSPEGDMPPQRGVALTELPEGQRAQVVHIEDEPKAVYAQLVAQGIGLNTTVRVFSKSATRLRFEADGEEQVLAPLAAANLTVVPLAVEPQGEPTVSKPLTTLASLRPGQQATVTGIASGCRGLARRRLLDLGVVPGSTVEAAMRSPGGDPTAYRVRGALIALRRDQADLIQIERLPTENAA